VKVFNLFCLLFIFFVSNCNAQLNFDSSTVAYYSFKGNSIDVTGNGNDGTVNGATLTNDRFGNENSAYYFSSAKCKTRINANINTSSIQSGLTISIWVMRVGDGCIGPRLFEFWAKNGPGQAQWHWDNNPSKKIIMGSTTSTGFNCYASLPKGEDNIWMHLAYTNDGKIGKFYQNGILVDSLQSKGNPILSGKVAFGRMNHRMWDAFNGKLDDIGIWNRALSENEIGELYHIDGWPLETDVTPEVK